MSASVRSFLRRFPRLAVLCAALGWLAGPDSAQAVDTDGDGMDDSYELLYPGVLDPAQPADALFNPDGDSRPNWMEFLMGSNPTNADEGGGLVINEVEYDEQAADTNEFVELLNKTSHTLSLTNIVLCFIDGNIAREYLRVRFTNSLAAGQYLVLAPSNYVISATNAVVVRFPGPQSYVLQNGPNDGALLLDLSSGIVLDGLSYEGSFGLIELSRLGFYRATELPAAFDSNAGTGSLCRIPNGADTDNGPVDWSLTTGVTPGAPNQ